MEHNAPAGSKLVPNRMITQFGNFQQRLRWLPDSVRSNQIRHSFAGVLPAEVFLRPRRDHCVQTAELQAVLMFVYVFNSAEQHVFRPCAGSVFNGATICNYLSGVVLFSRPHWEKITTRVSADIASSAQYSTAASQEIHGRQESIIFSRRKKENREKIQESKPLFKWDGYLG